MEYLSWLAYKLRYALRRVKRRRLNNTLGPLFMAQVMAQSRKLPEISSLKIAQKLKYFTKKVQNWPFLPFEKWFIALKTKNFAHFKK